MIWLVSTVWSFVNSIVRFLVQVRVLKSQQLGVRVISVGNIQAGGSGKTPLVGLIAREAIEHGKRVCILSRGYRGRWEHQLGVICPDMPCDPELTGDEPALLHQLVPGATIGVGADRIRSFRMALERSPGIDLVILDDGFQHWKIKKDLEIVALTPASRAKRVYRESNSALKRADLVIGTKGESGKEISIVVGFRIRKAVPERRRILLVTAVADPESVRKSALDAGYDILRQVTFPDHASYNLEQIQSLKTQARQAGASVALTGKDWVKWKALGVPDLSVVVLEPELEFVRGRDLWNRVLWER